MASALPQEAPSAAAGQPAPPPPHPSHSLTQSAACQWLELNALLVRLGQPGECLRLQYYSQHHVLPRLGWELKGYFRSRDTHVRARADPHPTKQSPGLPFQL